MKSISFVTVALFCVSVLLIIAFKKLGDETQFPLNPHRISSQDSTHTRFHASFIGEIPLPAGFTRVNITQNSFQEWLRNIKTRKDNTVYLYNGQPKERQDLHYAVLDISTGNKDLQQCADCIMRLKAEYYFQKNNYDSINFVSGNMRCNFAQWLSHTGASSKDRHALLMQFMEIVFTNCGTYTIDQMTRPVHIKDIGIGDVFVKAGAPGHAMIVTDEAINSEGKKIYLLAEGYMPAQDMHIVINPMNNILNPWYEVNNDEKIITPGFIFSNKQLKRFY